MDSTTTQCGIRERFAGSSAGKATSGALAVFWFLLPPAIVTRSAGSFVEAVIILTPLLAFALRGRGWLREYRWNRTIAAAIVFFAASTILAQFVPFHPVSALDSVRSFHLKFLFIALGVLFAVTQPSILKAFFAGCIAAMALAVFWGLYEWVLGSSAMPWDVDAVPGHLSPFGYHPNEFGAYLAYFLPLTAAAGLAFTRIGGRRGAKWIPICVILSLLGLWVLLLTRSRAAQGGFVVSMLLFLTGYLLKKRGARSRKPVLAAAGIVVLALVLLFCAVSLTKGGGRAAGGWRSSSLLKLGGRIERVWPEYRREIRPHLWLGLNFSRDLMDDYMDVHTHEHSMYLRFVVDSGLVGLSGFLVLFAVLLAAGLRRLKQLDDGVHYLLLLGVVSGVIGALVLRSIVAKAYNNQLEYFTSLLLALSCVRGLGWNDEGDAEQAMEGDVVMPPRKTSRQSEKDAGCGV